MAASPKAIGAGLKQVITGAANKYGIDPAVLYGVWKTESGGTTNPGTSSAGAVGPFQFLPSTAKGMGVDPYNFTSAAQGAARYLGEYKDRGTAGMLSAYNAGPGGAAQPAYVASVLGNAKSYGGPVPAVAAAAKVSGVSGKSAAAKSASPAFTTRQETSIGQILLPLLGANNLLYKTGVLSTTPDTIRTPVQSAQKPSGAAAVASKANPAPPAVMDHQTLADTSSGVVTPHMAWNPAAKPIPAWISPILDWAHQHGWQGTVTSGVRTHAQQLQAATSYVAGKGVTLAQNYPQGVYASNHISPDWPHGAVDVTDPQELNRVLARYPGQRRLVWGGPTIGDPVHFSANGH